MGDFCLNSNYLKALLKLVDFFDSSTLQLKLVDCGAIVIAIVA